MYNASEKRYENMIYNRCGNSGLKLPAVSLGLWHNFGDTGSYETMKQICCTAFDNGVTHFDLANNYGPEPGSAEKNFGRILKEDLEQYRDELIISTKAGYDMWPGPYGNWGSRKYLLASLDQSLKRMGLEYVDIFYHHRMDPETPLEETMGALAQAVASGFCAWISSCSGRQPDNGRKAASRKSTSSPRAACTAALQPPGQLVAGGRAVHWGTGAWLGSSMDTSTGCQRISQGQIRPSSSSEVASSGATMMPGRASSTTLASGGADGTARSERW